jgi:hypothetical protein
MTTEPKEEDNKDEEEHIDSESQPHVALERSKKRNEPRIFSLKQEPQDKSSSSSDNTRSPGNGEKEDGSPFDGSLQTQNNSFLNKYNQKDECNPVIDDNNDEDIPSFPPPRINMIQNQKIPSDNNNDYYFEDDDPPPLPPLKAPTGLIPNKVVLSDSIIEDEDAPPLPPRRTDGSVIPGGKSPSSGGGVDDDFDAPPLPSRKEVLAVLPTQQKKNKVGVCKSGGVSKNNSNIKKPVSKSKTKITSQKAVNVNGLSKSKKTAVVNKNTKINKNDDDDDDDINIPLPDIPSLPPTNEMNNNFDSQLGGIELPPLPPPLPSIDFQQFEDDVDEFPALPLPPPLPPPSAEMGMNMGCVMEMVVVNGNGGG